MHDALKQWEAEKAKIDLQRSGFIDALVVFGYGPLTAKGNADFRYPHPPRPEVRRAYTRSDGETRYRVSGDGLNLEYETQRGSGTFARSRFTREDVEQFARLFLTPNE